MSTESLSKCAVIHPSPEISESPGKRLKSEPETPLEWKREEDMDLNDFRNLYDDRKEPFHYHSDRLVYKNKAQIRLDEEIEKAMAEYKERKRNLSRSDAIDPPEIVGLCGCIAPVTITDDIRPLLISLCNLALDKYNAETENQGESFVFDGLVKSTRGLAAGYIYYITFQAKAKDVTKTFQAQVWDGIPGPPEVESCSMKPI